MKVLIIGGGGFLGTWTIRRLLGEGHSIRVLDIGQPSAHFSRLINSDEVEWISGSAVDTATCIASAQGCDAVLHMAGVLTPFCRENPIEGAMINVIGTLNAFEAAHANNISRLVYTGSGGVYGPKDRDEPWPTTHYGAYKLANEGNARAYFLDRGISSLGLRPFIIYGPGRETGLTAGPTIACQAAAQGKPYTIPYTGRSGMVFVEDVVEACVRGLTVEFEGAYTVNLPGEDADVSDIADAINQIAGADLITFGGPELPSPSTASGYDGSDSIGVLPVTPMIEGLRKTISFYAA